MEREDEKENNGRRSRRKRILRDTLSLLEDTLSNDVRTARGEDKDAVSSNLLEHNFLNLLSKNIRLYPLTCSFFHITCMMSVDTILNFTL